MKRIIVMMLAFAMIMSFAACSNETTQETTEPTAAEATATAEPTAEPRPDWEYDDALKTLYVYVDMGAFEPDAPDFEGSASNAPWSEHLPEIENIIVGDDVTFIGDYAFAFCPNLKNVEVGSNVGALDFRCFFKCGDFENDSSINLHFNSTPQFGDDVFGYTWDNPNVMVYVPDDMKDHWASYMMQKGEMQLDGYDMQQANGNEDFGPFWSINIGGNFDIMSDMVWQSVEPQDFKIGDGDAFKGYVLKDLMDMSGNGCESAKVYFSDGSEMDVNPTYDAFVVYKQNDAFMGGPYLLTMNGLSQSPITNVQPDNMQGNNNNGGEGYGPSWAINIGGNFDIMSDMIWQSVAPQDFKIGSGDTFKGYVLKDLMDFSGNSSDKASVTFGESGIANAQIDATYDAFIVYMQNGEFLGGPYLLTMEGLWEYPVIAVNPN